MLVYWTDGMFGAASEREGMMWIAKVDTGSFDFTAWGTTESDARANLERGLRRHARQYGLPRGWASEMVSDAAWLLEIPAGGCMRDDSLIS